MITPKILKIIKQSQAKVIEFNLEQFTTNSSGYFLSVRRDGVYEVTIVHRADLEKFFEEMKENDWR